MPKESLFPTPISTIKLETEDWDPRSLSTNVIPTPIEIVATPKRAPTTDNIQPKFENNCKGLYQLRLHDSKSPSVEIIRTTILIGNEKYTQ